MSGEILEDQNPLLLLRQATNETLSVDMVRNAANWLDANSETAASEAEEVFGMTAYGYSLHPESEDWLDACIAIEKIYNNRVKRYNQSLI